MTSSSALLFGCKAYQIISIFSLFSVAGAGFGATCKPIARIQAKSSKKEDERNEEKKTKQFCTALRRTSNPIEPNR